MSPKKLLFSLCFMLHTLQAGSSAAIDINNKDVELLTTFDFSHLTYYAAGTAYVVDGSYLHTENHSLVTVGISGENALQGVEGLSLAFGLKSAIASDFLAFPLMAKATYRLPFNDRVPPTYLSGSFAYAPEVLSFNEAQSYSEFRLEADMEMISNIHIFTGYRNINTDYAHIKRTWNNHFYAGLKLKF